MNKPRKTLSLNARIWRLCLPFRWPLTRIFWLLSRLCQATSLVFWAIHVGIDYVRLVYWDYSPRPDDIFIVSYPRSGTTWLQMILYQLTTDGNMDFVHISDVCPWFERAALNKREFESLRSPRVFKSHLPYLWMPKRANHYIYVARNGKDVAVSFYHFYKSHLRYKGDFASFFKLYMRGWVAWGSWFSHVSGWWRHRHHPHVLFLRFEDMVDDLESSVRKIIDFCGLDVPEDRLPEILQRCSFAFMKQHEEKFDHATEFLREHGFTPGRFLRQGKVGNWEELFTDEQQARFDHRCEVALGCGLNEMR